MASISSIVLTTLCDHFFLLHDSPALLETVLACVIINGIVHFAVAAPEPPKAPSMPKSASAQSLL